MSAILSGLNIKNIFEYNSGLSYSKYDVIDFQLHTGYSIYPNYTGFGQTGLTTWFNNDSLEYFETDGNFNVTGWNNLVTSSGKLIQTNDNVNFRPFVNFNEYYVDVNGPELISGTGFSSNSRTVFVIVEAGNITYPQQTQKIFKFGTSNTYGFIKLSGANDLGSAKVFIDNQSNDAVSSIYDSKNIFTIIQNNSDSSLKLRQNGIQIGNYASYNSAWSSSQLTLGDNNDNQSLKYYEFIHFSGVLSENQIIQYEKYLYEKYFDNKRLYFAKNNVPVGFQYSPITFSGSNYWTQDIDDLFKMTYGCSANFTAALSNLDMGDGYQTNVAKNLNTLNTNFNLSYNGLTDIQAKALIAFFENTPEAPKRSIYEGFKGVNINLFTPYKKNAELYFKDINHNSPYNNLNNIQINAESLFDSSINYKGMLIELDEINIRTYTNVIDQLKYNDVFYYESNSFANRGYYFYTGENFANTETEIYFPTTVAPENSPTGNNSWFTKDFYFKGDIDYGIDSKIRLKVNDAKNSTVEYDKDGINYNLLEFNVSFNNRSNSEARAILKFLDDKAGFKTFKYILPQPYNKRIIVYCPEWSHTYKFYDNNDIVIKLKELKAPFDIQTAFDTRLYFSI